MVIHPLGCLLRQAAWLGVQTKIFSRNWSIPLVEDQVWLGLALKLFLSWWISGIKRNSSTKVTNIYHSFSNNLHCTLTFTVLWNAGPTTTTEYMHLPEQERRQQVKGHEVWSHQVPTHFMMEKQDLLHRHGCRATLPCPDPCPTMSSKGPLLCLWVRIACFTEVFEVNVLSRVAGSLAHGKIHRTGEQ